MSNLNHTQKLERELATERKACETFAELNVELEHENAELREALSVRRIARAVFRALPPPGALPDDWDSEAEIGANNAERVRYTMAASKILKSLLQGEGNE